MYYSHKTTGRPYEKNLGWCTHYIDCPNAPLYPFGFGLSFTTFQYSDIRLDRREISQSDTLKATVTLKNRRQFDGEEIVQMYIRDLKASITRPVKELKGFQKIRLRKGEEKEVTFSTPEPMLRFYDQDLACHSEPGEFKVFIGSSSMDVKEASFYLVDSLEK